jgi:hypothetical protein
MWCSQKGHKWRHNMAHTPCMLDKQDYIHAHACTRSRARTPTRTYARTGKYVMLIAFPRQQWFANVPQYYVIRALPVLFNLGARWVCVVNTTPQPLYPWKEASIPILRPWGRSRGTRKISPRQEFEARTLQPAERLCTN